MIYRIMKYNPGIFNNLCRLQESFTYEHVWTVDYDDMFILSDAETSTARFSLHIGDGHRQTSKSLQTRTLSSGRLPSELYVGRCAV
jgi:hypothetical protein